MKTLITICLTLCLLAANASAQLLKSGTVQLLGSGTTSLTGSNGVLLIGGSPISVATISGTIAATQVTGTAATLGGNNTLVGTNNFTGALQIGGVSIGSIYQPLDSDLTAIAALATTSAGRSLLTLASVPVLTGTSFNGVNLSGTNGATITLGGYTLNQNLSTTSAPTFAALTVTSGLDSAAYVSSSTGHDSGPLAGQVGNQFRKYATVAAAYASGGNPIVLGVGDYSLTITGAWDNTSSRVFRGSGNATNFIFTINACNLIDATGFVFDNISGSLTINGDGTPLSLANVGFVMLNGGYMDTYISGAATNLGGMTINATGQGGLPLTCSGDGTAGSVTGSATVTSAYAGPITITNAASDVEIYLIDCGTPSVAAIYSDGGTTKTGEINAIGGYGYDLTAATVRVQNATYTALAYTGTNYVNGGGNRNEASDIANVGVTGTYGSATQSLTLTSSNGAVTSVSAQTVTPAWGSVTGKPTLPTVSGTASVSVNPNGLLLGQMSETSVAVTGAAIGDEVILGPPSNPPSFISWAGYVKATGTATIRVSAIATVTGSAQTWNVKTITP